MTMTTDEVVEYLQKFIPNTQPKDRAEIENPNYGLYALAPFWFPHQALCLLAGLKTLDVHTFRTCLALNSLQLKMNSVLPIGKGKPSGQGYFSDFIVHYFPIPHSKITYLRNLDEKMSEALKNGSLPCKKEIIDKTQETLLNPKEVIMWMEKEGIKVSSQLLEALPHRDKIDMLFLPKTFPDEVNVYAKWTSLRIDYNLSKPQAPATLGALASPFVPVEKKTSGEKNEKENLQAEGMPTTIESNEPILTDRAKEIYEEMFEARKQCISFYIELTFGRNDVKHIGLIEKFGIPGTIEEFTIYNKGGPKPKKTEHHCRAMARVIRHFDENVSIKDLERHALMIQYGKRGKKVAFSTFRKWMHAEGIYDRPPSDNLS